MQCYTYTHMLSNKPWIRKLMQFMVESELNPIWYAKHYFCDKDSRLKLCINVDWLCLCA